MWTFLWDFGRDGGHRTVTMPPVTVLNSRSARLSMMSDRKLRSQSTTTAILETDAAATDATMTDNVMEKFMTDMRQSLQSVNDKLDNVISGQNDLRALFDDLDKRVNDVDGRVKKNTVEIANLAKSIDFVSAITTDNRDKVSALSANLDGSKDDLAAAKSTIRNLDEELLKLQWKVIDCATNSHGNALQEFLLDSKCCVLNGGVTPQCDNYTFIEPSRGKSVVDYFITPIDVLKKRVEFHVYSSRTLIDIFMYADSLPINSIPGHSFLLFRISTEPGESTENSLGSVNRPAQVFRLPLVIKQHACHVTQSNRLTFSISGSKQTNHLNFFVNQTLHKRP